MALPPLTIIPAGAGSGKTYTIQTKLSEWVGKGLVAPERIVAVTFTEAAAAELRGRIRSELVKAGRIEDALKLDQAYISTIHGFGLRLLSEFAFDAGESPDLRLLTEDEQEILIRRALAATDKADEVLMRLGAFGYRYNGESSAEDQFRARVMLLIRKLRAIGRLGPDSDLLPHVRKRVKELYGETVDGDQLEKNLKGTIKALLRKFPGSMADLYPGNAKATGEFRQNFRDLKAAAETDALSRDWKLWQRLRGLRLSKKGSATPDGYDDLAVVVMEAASALPRHPGPLDEALVHAESILSASQDSMERYAVRKKEKGLIDYTDMLALSSRMMTTNSKVLDVLKERVDCVVIDEFQDTNPIQFSLLWSLVEAGVPALIVGDLKQSIMGFQEADSRLLAALQDRFKEQCEPLDKNWRSSRELMGWINEVGTGLFEDAYTPLEPQMKYESKVSPLEVIHYNQGPTQAVYAQHIAARIKGLLEEGGEIYDKDLKTHRPVRGGDIAVLIPNNDRVKKYADEFRSMGVRTRIEEDGWFQSRIVQLTSHALDLVADPSDRYAALYMAVTELGSYNLQTALKKILDGEDLDDPVIAALYDVADGSPDRAVDAVLQDVIEALDLYGVISKWPDTSQVRADLLRFQSEAMEFIGSNRDALASGGYYGTGVKSFLSWLRGRIERKDGNRKPSAGVSAQDDVRLMTWHKSKGLEWPIVFVCGLDRKIRGRLPSQDVVYEDFSNFSQILEKARIEISPDFVAPETKDAFLALLDHREETEALNELYVALTRAREKVVLEWPAYLDGKDSTTYYSILSKKARMELVGNRMKTGDVEFDCRVNAGAKGSPPETGEKSGDLKSDLPVYGRRAVVPGDTPEGLTPDSITPSGQHDEACTTTQDTKTYEYGQPLTLELNLGSAERGTFLHRCFEIASGSHERMNRIPQATGTQVTGEQLEAIYISIAAFDQWLEKSLLPVQLQKEVPILALDAAGSIVSGYVDLLVETEEGYWIIDHKSDVTDDLENRFAYYLPQLACYAEAVKRACPDKPVLGVVVNWISVGKVVNTRTS